MISGIPAVSSAHFVNLGQLMIVWWTICDHHIRNIHRKNSYGGNGKRVNICDFTKNAVSCAMLSLIFHI